MGNAYYREQASLWVGDFEINGIMHKWSKNVWEYSQLIERSKLGIVLSGK